MSEPQNRSRPPRQGRPRSINKNRAILDAASELFLERGYERTTMERVARAAGVSKQTVYSHFTNKERLFRAVIAGRVADYFPGTEEMSPVTGDRGRAGTVPAHRHDITARLHCLGLRYMRLILSDDAVALFRLLTSVPQNEARLVALFYEEGPERLADMFQAEIAKACKCGALACDDPDAAATLLGTLLRGEVFLQRVLGLAGEMPPDAIIRHVTKAVAVFLAVYPETGRAGA